MGTAQKYLNLKFPRPTPSRLYIFRKFEAFSHLFVLYILRNLKITFEEAHMISDLGHEETVCLLIMQKSNKGADQVHARGCMVSCTTMIFVLRK